MTDLRFTVRDKAGQILDVTPSDTTLSWHEPERENIIEAMANLPIYNRGKLKADLMLRNVPKKELGYYDAAAYELVISEQFYLNLVRGATKHDQSHYCEGHYYRCYAIDPRFFHTLHLKYPVYEFTQVGLYNLVEYELFQDCRKPCSLDDIDELIELGEWIRGFNSCLSFKVRIEENSSYGLLYVSHDDFKERYICHLSYWQAKFLKTNKYNNCASVDSVKHKLDSDASRIYGKEVAV